MTKVGFWVWVALLLGFPWLMYTGSFATTAANAAVLLGGFFAVVSVGEIVVAGIARLLGDRPGAFVIGVGPIILQRKVGSLLVQFRAMPLFGVTIVATTRRDGQWVRYALARVVSAGMLVTVAVVLFGRLGSLPALRTAMESRFAPDAYLVVVCFFAAMFSMVTLLGASFQLPLWHRLGRELEVAEMLQRGAYADAEAQCRALLGEFPDDASLQISLASVLSHRRSDEALALLEAVRAREGLPPDVRAVADNNFAWQCYLSERGDLLADAERAIEQALQQQPANAHFIGTRGHVFLWAKRYAEAEPMITKAHALFAPDARSSRVTSAAGMALLCAATDRPDEARSWLDRARAEDIPHDLVARAIAAVEPLSRK